MGQIIGFLVGKFGAVVVKAGVLSALFFAKWLIIISFYGGLLLVFGTVYGLISDVLNMISNPSTLSGGNCLTLYASYALSALGIIDAINASLPLVLSALTFLMGVFSYGFMISIKNTLERDTKAMLKLI